MSICKDCFHSYVCEQFNKHRECDNKKCHFANDHFISADLINRQKAEIEQFKKIKPPIVAKQSNAENNINIAHIKAEAYKEFAERVNEEAIQVGIDEDFLEYTLNGVWKTYYAVGDLIKDITNNLLKELVVKNDIGRYDPYTDTFVKELVGDTDES